jgi:hypothetical protein
MRLFLLILLSGFAFLNSHAQSGHTTLLPEGVTYDSGIPAPEVYFGFAPGERHLSYDQVLSYAREIDRLSGRVIIEEYARSHEFRPLVHLIVTSEQNHRRLDELKAIHAAFSEPGNQRSAAEVPLVVLLGYGVHGNESSATNASVLSLYHLAAAKGPYIDSLLNQTIILIDPCLNPDGFTRHSTWVNMHQGKTDVSDPYARGFTEAWPGGRGNHYWFDLNRDYLFMVHPESRGRIIKYHEWKPDVVTDHHEMGANSTFFFQPGIPTRNNPLVPVSNFELTQKIAAFHRQSFDARGELYFSEDSFDDYYVGKGSSYPDINGSVGILFEQAGYRGKIRETSYGTKTLASAIKNQFDITLSTLEAAFRMRNELLQSQRTFYDEAAGLAQTDPVKAYVFGVDSDPERLLRFTDILLTHRIEVFELASEFTKDGMLFTPGKAAIVPMSQPQYRLVKSLFETVSDFTDSTFYDVSTWTLPLAFNLDLASLTTAKELQQLRGNRIDRAALPEGEFSGDKDSYAWVMRWDQHNAPAALWQMLDKNLFVTASTREFSVQTGNGIRKFGYGSIVIPVASQKNYNPQQLFEYLNELSISRKVEITGVHSGRSVNGADLGSGSFVPLSKPGILMVTGESVNSRDAGELWHLFDQHFEIPVTLLDISSFRSINLYRYTTLVLPGGTYRSLTQQDVSRLKAWLNSGGTLLTVGDAGQWTTAMEITTLKFKPVVAVDSGKVVPWVIRAEASAIHAVAGIILKAEADITHPVAYGYNGAAIPVFKSGTRIAEAPAGQYSAPVKFAQQPWISGYISPANLNRAKGAPVVIVARSGEGRVISFMESQNFRGIWLATNKMFANALFFAPLIR